MPNPGHRLPLAHAAGALCIAATLALTPGFMRHALAAEGPSQSAQRTAEDIVRAFDALFAGPHPGFRAVHAKGLLLEGTFTPSEAASMLSRAVHFQARVPVLVRFSNFAGVPTIADGAGAAGPRGMAIKFMLPDGGDTDIVAHSYNGFPVATAEDFLGFLRALADPEASVLKDFAARQAAARTFLDTPKPAPASFATERFFGVTAFRFTNAVGVSRYGRYRLEPVAGTAYLSDDAAAQRPPGYLADELADRLRKEAARFRLLVQIAASGDPISDGSKPWPEERAFVDAGMLTLTALVPDGHALQRGLLFTPLNLVGGISGSGDPLLVARNRAYRISFDRRQAEAARKSASSLGQ